ncbi:NuA4 histone H4 acetyltransferase complex and the SWR1 complex subunit [Polyrhizophydium stewartii]|uniref:Protein AF-9 homolog n=1 Tax=Polyrhizophydium stewartii TaxID=2732419 RepID=A0ABR4NA21_9FUNG|nr:NuA4 histone H4 acetyltransferase complex and the SWR1 complex subunit [Polyrhizophydium stewartii]
MVPFIYGSTATPISKKDNPSDPSHTHKWSVYVRGVNGEDLSFCIKRVTIKLHESFAVPTRVIESPPFEVTETGWGEFEIMIKISFVDSNERPVTLYHQLQLYPKDEAAIQAQGKKPVIINHYEELVFNEPTEDMIEGLRAYNAVPRIAPVGTYSTQAEEEELLHLDDVHSKLLAEHERQKRHLVKVEEELRLLQAEIRELERQ